MRSKGRKICIVSDKHLHANPRVWKEATTLANNGYEVSVVTQFSSVDSIKQDEALLKRLDAKFEYKAGVDMTPGRAKKSTILFYKVRRKLAATMKKLTGLDSEYLITYAPEQLYGKALLEDADLYIAHVEGGYCVGKRLHKAKKNVAFDQEDWFSRDYLVPERPVKLLSSLERYALKHGQYVTCPSEAMASGLESAYKTNKPSVVYNCFPKEELPKDITTTKISLVWFSQTIGSGRGLERIIDTIKKLDVTVSLLLIGNCSDAYKQTLLQRLGADSAHELKIQSPVPHHELHEILLQQDIGLALENDHPDNKDTTVSNKMFQYLQAGLKVLATDTKGQAEVGEKFPDAVMLVDAGNDGNWNDKLQELIDRKVSAVSIAEKYYEHFSWEQQEAKLLSLVETALS